MKTIQSEARKEQEMLTKVTSQNWKDHRPEGWSEMTLTQQANWMQKVRLIPNPLILQ